MPVNIWDLAIQQRKQQQSKPSNNTDNQEDGATTDDDAKPPTTAVDNRRYNEQTHLLIVGSKEAGKTSLVLRFLDQDEQPKPTIALEYTYGRRTRGNTKEVVHIWELGGGTFLGGLLKIPIKPATIDTLSIIIAVDLSKLDELWVTTLKLVQEIRKNVDASVATLKRQQPSLAAEVERRAWDRERNLIRPFLVPVVFVGTKYDLFQNFDSEQKKLVCKTLRFLAHSNGASLHFFSSKLEALISKGRALVSHLAFGTSPSKTLVTDHNKPLSIPFGMDSYKEIGLPSSTSDVSAHANTPLELWQASYSQQFPQKDITQTQKDDPAKDPQYKEPKIDQLRAYKDEELERYLRQRERLGKQKPTADEDDGGSVTD